MEKNTELGNLNGLMAHITRVNSRIIISKARGNTSGGTEGSMRETGKIIRWKVRVFSPGQITGDMRDNT